MTTIHLEQRTAEALEAKARALGMSLEVFLRQVAGTDDDAAGASNGAAGGAAAAELDRTLDELFAQDTRSLPSSPLTYSREDIYSDHD